MAKVLLRVLTLTLGACLLSVLTVVVLKNNRLTYRGELPQQTLSQQTTNAFQAPVEQLRGELPQQTLSQQTTNAFQKYFITHSTSQLFWKPSHYVSAYDEHLARFLKKKNSDVHLAEVIGTHNEGSLEMWRKVFGSGLNLYGITRTKAVPTQARFGARIFRWAERSFWAEFRQQVPYLDVLVVAGVTQQEHVQALEGALEHIRPGGILIFENFHNEGIGREDTMRQLYSYFGGLHAGRRPRLDPIQASIESIHFYPWMLVVKKTLELRDNMNAPRHGSIWNPMHYGVTRQDGNQTFAEPWWHDPPSLKRDPSNKFLEYFLEKKVGQGIWKPLHYFPAYDKYLAKFETAPEFHIAEIGIYSGGSLEMWRSVFGQVQRLHVYGIDIANITKVYEQLDTTGRTRIFIGNQHDQVFWTFFRREVPRLDALIDDGSHSWKDQKAALDGALDHLRPGGVYMTEDAHTLAQVRGFDYFASLHADNPAILSHMQQTIESVSYYPWLIVVQKADALRNELGVTKVP